MVLLLPLTWYQNFSQCSLGRRLFFFHLDLIIELVFCIPVHFVFSPFLGLWKEDWVNYVRLFFRLWQWKFTLILFSFVVYQAIFLHQFSPNCNHYYTIVYQYYTLGPLGSLWLLPQLFNDNIYWESFPRRIFMLHVVQ